LQHSLRVIPESSERSGINLGNLGVRTARGMHAFRRIRSWAPTFKKGSESRKIAVEFGVTFGSMYLLTTYGVGFTICAGESMMPTLDGEWQLVLIDRFSYKVQGKDYQVGDVIVSQSKIDPSKSE
jgi:signal peptidase I